MTRLKTGTATIALALALAASPALANQEMRENADQIMNDYGFDVDASLLSDEQLIQFMVLDDLEDKPRAAVSNRISGILDDNPATETYASGVTVEWMTGERDQLVAHADQVMNDYGVEAEPGGAVWAFQSSGLLIVSGPGEIISQGTWTAAEGAGEFDAVVDMEVSGQRLEVLGQVSDDTSGIALYVTSTDASRPPIAGPATKPRPIAMPRMPMPLARSRPEVVSFAGGMPATEALDFAAVQEVVQGVLTDNRPLASITPSAKPSTLPRAPTSKASNKIMRKISLRVTPRVRKAPSKARRCRIENVIVL